MIQLDELTLPKVQAVIRELQRIVEPLQKGNIDLNGRRIINAGKAVGEFDYVRLFEVEEKVSAATTQSTENVTALSTTLLGTFIRFGGTTSSFPALKRSGAILQVRLADDSAYTDLEVLDEAYDATNWDGSVEVPTKNAIRDKIEGFNIVASVYTPTLTNGANVAASTAYQCQYCRLGSVVIVSGRIEVDPTAAAGTSTDVGISLPIASNFGATEDLGGTAVANAQDQAAAIYADAANDRAKLEFLSNVTANTGLSFIFSYRVI